MDQSPSPSGFPFVSKTDTMSRFTVAGSPYHSPCEPYTITSSQQGVVRFINALKSPLVAKLSDLTVIINETITGNPRDLHSFFISIVSTAFDLPAVHINSLFSSVGGCESFASWQIRSIYKEDNLWAFDRLIEFFNPSKGIFFHLMRVLSADPTGSKCDFPITELPLPARESIVQGVPNQFYAGKLIGNTSFISVSPLEYFLLALFRYAKLDQEPMPMNRLYHESFASTSKPHESAFLLMFEMYLEHFLPIDTVSNQQTNSQNQQTQHSIWESLSSKTSHLLHLQHQSSNASPNSSISSAPGQLYQQRLQLQRPSLINMKQVTRSDSTANELNCDALGSTKVKAELFLGYFSEIVLNVVPRKKSVHKSISPLCTNNQVQPSIDHIRCVRMFVKYAHDFVNSSPSLDTLADPQYRVGRSPLEGLKLKLWTSEMNVQYRLFNFLRYSFEIWPLDASFKLPLETWLSYIQPWRYQRSKGISAQVSGQSAHQNINEPPVTNEWTNFIRSNLPFYNTILYLSFQKFTRFDLVSTKTSSMLSRVIKVYSKPGFLDLVNQVEQSLGTTLSDTFTFFHGNYFDNSGKRLPSDSYSPNHHQLIKSTMSPGDSMVTESSDHETECILLTSERFRTVARELYNCIVLASKYVKEQLNQVSPNEGADNGSANSAFKSFLTFVASIFDATDGRIDVSSQNNEFSHIDLQLTTCASRMVGMFGSLSDFVDCGSNDSNVNQLRQRHVSTSSHLKGKSIKPETIVTEDGGVQLSPLGRYQILNRIAEPTLPTIEGNPDTQPTRSFEIHFLVVLLYAISTFVNTRARNFIDKWYPDGTFLSKFLQLLLSPPVSYTRMMKGTTITGRYVDGGILTPAKRQVEHLPARISLRFLASKINLALALLFYFFCRLLGWSVFNLTLYSLALTFVYSILVYAVKSLT